jgi:tRNA(Ile)-lysidine synthase
MSLIDKVRQTIRQYKLINKAEKIVIGVSGGPDSLALLYVLKALQKEWRAALHIAHLNHMLRGRESQGDAEFVVRLAQKLNIPVTMRKINLAGLKQGGSAEEIARKARLEFLFAVARKNKAHKIALGHNSDDQAETVLMRVIRGSGLLGLSGILPKRKINNFIIIRPLIEIPRREITNFLKAKKIKPRIDATNSEEIYFRNRIRHKLLPELRRYNPNIRQVLANTAQNIAADYDYLLETSRRAFANLRTGKGKVKLSIVKFLKLHPALQNIVLRLAYSELKGDTRRLTYQHIKEVKDLIYSRPCGAIVDLPSSIFVIKNHRYFSFKQKAASSPPRGASHF